MVFMVTPSSGDEPTALITLADYYEWLPGYVSAEDAFEKPANAWICQARAERKASRDHPSRAGVATSHLIGPR